MILVTVGSSADGFNRVIEQVDGLKGEHKINDNLVMQIGHGSYIPKNADRFFRFTSWKEINDLHKKVDCVISHAGAGSILTALAHGKPFIGVPRLKKLGEHTNNHQVDMARVLVNEGKMLMAGDKKGILDCISKVRGGWKPKSGSTKNMFSKRVLKSLGDFRFSGRPKICFICSSGGHLIELLPLGEVMKKFDRFWITFESPISRQTLGGERIYTTKEPVRNPVRFLKVFYDSLRVFLKERPDAIITTGAGVVIPFCFISWVFRKKIIYIESFCRTYDRSLSGRILYPISSLFLVQWKHMLREHGRNVRYFGQVY